MYRHNAQKHMNEAFGTVVVSAGSLAAATYGIANLLIW